MRVDAIYTWPDGSFVSAVVDPGALSRVMFRIESRSRATWVGINDDDPAVLHPLVSTAVDKLSTPHEEGLGPKLLGLALDLGVRRPSDGIRSSLAFTRRQDDETPPLLPYPRWVDDVRWEGRYEEADRYILKQVASHRRPVSLSKSGTVSIPSEWQSVALNEELFLGIVERLQILPPAFYLDDTWHATCSGQTGDPESRYFHGLVDLLLDLELILPVSSRRAWEAEYVERGSWVIPSPDAVEVFRLLGEDLPWLWPMDRLTTWLGSQP